MARFKAFKRSMIDVFIETNLNRLQHSYNFPAVPDRYIIKKVFQRKPSPDLNSWGLFFNMRRVVFKDKRVRQVLSILFDFEWIKHHLFNNIYTRTESYWNSSITPSKA
ncbi:ABC transporter substrate-binding protein [Bartonella taylorii]|nr:ABC transporter substrate-binding protein [Bartonella taylorii]